MLSGSLEHSRDAAVQDLLMSCLLSLLRGCAKHAVKKPNAPVVPGFDAVFIPEGLEVPA